MLHLVCAICRSVISLASPLSLSLCSLHPTSHFSSVFRLSCLIHPLSLSVSNVPPLVYLTISMFVSCLFLRLQCIASHAHLRLPRLTTRLVFTLSKPPVSLAFIPAVTPSSDLSPVPFHPLSQLFLSSLPRLSNVSYGSPLVSAVSLRPPVIAAPAGGGRQAGLVRVVVGVAVLTEPLLAALRLSGKENSDIKSLPTTLRIDVVIDMCP